MEIKICGSATMIMSTFLRRLMRNTQVRKSLLKLRICSENLVLECIKEPVLSVDLHAKRLPGVQVEALKALGFEEAEALVERFGGSLDFV